MAKLEFAGPTTNTKITVPAFKEVISADSSHDFNRLPHAAQLSLKRAQEMATQLQNGI